MDNETPETAPNDETASVEETQSEQPVVEQPVVEQPEAAAETAPVAETVDAPATEQASAEATEAPAVSEPAGEPAAATDAPAASETADEPAVEQSAEEPGEIPEQSAEDGEVSALPELTLGSGAPADEELGTVVRMSQTMRGKVDEFGVAIGTGRRKTSVARVRIKDGDGKLTINGRALDDYFPTERDRQQVRAPLRATDAEGSVDVWVRVGGGGTTGQAGAIVLGIARALQVKEPSLHGPLSEGGYLTRDGRMVERKKFGYKKARKSFQFSKR